jgi:hypothetical protein
VTSFPRLFIIRISYLQGMSHHSHAGISSTNVEASREFVQRLVDQHPPTQALLQRVFPATLLSLLRKPLQGSTAPPPGPNWPLFWKVASSESHSLAGLVWDEDTRHELRLCVPHNAIATCTCVLVVAANSAAAATLLHDAVWRKGLL